MAPWLPTVGGGQIIAFELSKALANLQNHVDVILVAPENQRRAIEWGNVRYVDSKGTLSKLRESLGRNLSEYDIIHIHEGNENVGYGLGFGIKNTLSHEDLGVGTFISMYSPNVHRFPRSPEELFWRFSCRQVDRIFVLSEFAGSNISTAYRILPSRIVVTHAGVEESFLRPKNGTPSSFEPSTLLFCGRITDPNGQKGLDTLLSAMPEIVKRHNALLNVVGTGSGLNKCKTLARILKIEANVNFLGFVAHEFLPEIFANADIFVLPSRRESFGLVLAEAMASGLPVVSTNVGAIPEVVEDGKNGTLVNPDSPRELAEAICTLLDDRERMKSMGVCGRERVLEHFVWDVVAQRVIECYRKVLSRL
jgi:glycosyltransferase involved in cell wall biosynthesis